MSDRETAIAVRDRIGRLYGYSGPYGTTNPTPEITEPFVEETVEVTQTAAEEIDMVFNRFKPDSVAGRILKALASGPKTPAQLAHLAGSKSADNIIAPGGWFYQLRKFGKTTGKFKLEKEDNRLVLTVGKRYASQV
jgi:hypothetical protein